MLFKPEHIGMIEKDIKTATRRDWEKPMAKVGGVYRTKTNLMSRDYYQVIEVKKMYLQRLGDMTEEDAQKEGGYTLKKFRDIWIEINGFWSDDFVVTVIEFKYAARGNTIIPKEWREIK